jgi:NADH dehydrogenase
MILVTGGTGFIGQVLVRNLVSLGYPVRLLINPSNKTPRIPRGISVDAAISSIYDERNLRAAMKDVRTVFHLIGTEWRGINAEYFDVDIEAGKNTAAVAAQMGVERFFYLSHLGTDRSSAYALLQAKAKTEAAIIESGVPYTILRTAPIYGKGDHFTEAFAAMIRKIPFAVPLPGDGETRIQPLWIDDLITCLLLCMDDERTVAETIEIGGIETLTIRECLELIMDVIGVRKHFYNISPVWLRSLMIAMEQWFERWPQLYFWADYLAEDRITSLDVLPRRFSLFPTRMSRNLDYLRES